ncbi:MAG TPA: hypothetical protein VNM48_10840 [Chloroflexota bacterium]|nr:hypothetical protein [Chloroflexota bacterium]
MRNQTTIAVKQADYAMANLAADVPLVLERAIKGGVPKRALFASIRRVLGVAIVSIAAAEAAGISATYTGKK